ncbi:MAG TPA: amino acid adenylation domain-containing protein [Verrucomicrobiales bacterium]|nr:amino acid adenylation domain-containing protein [Verrucomicrobiales bacterium]
MSQGATPDPREGLSKAKLKLLEQRLAGVSRRDAQPAGIPKRSSPGPVPLAPGQEGLWLLRQLHPDSPSYNVTSSFRVEGRLDTGLLGRCATRVVERHEILRSVLRSSGSSGTEILTQPAAEIEVATIECGSEPLMVRAERQARLPFEPQRGAMLRLAFLQHATEGSLLMLVVDHLVCDEWSLSVFWNEIVQFYRAALTGTEPGLPEPVLQYADFALWQRERLAAGLRQEQLAFWRAELRDIPAALDLPTTWPRRVPAGEDGRLEKRLLGGGLTARLKTLAASENASLFMLLLLAYQILLGRYSGQSDFVVGIPAANRKRPELAGVIGFFVSTIPFRARLADDISVREALCEVRDRALAGLARLDLPFDELVRDLDPPRAADRDPMFQVMFVYQREAEAAQRVDLGTARLSPVHVETHTAKFDLTLFAVESGENTECFLEYRTELFDRRMMTRMLGHYEALLWEMARNPGKPAGSLEMLEGEEMAEILALSASAAADAAEAPMVHEIISGLAQAAPTAPAIVFEETVVSRGALDARVKALSALLAKRKVGPGDRAGIFLDRSPDAIASMLAVLRRGAAYVPVDPGYPPARRRLLLQDSSPRAVFSEKRFQRETGDSSLSEWICIDEESLETECLADGKTSGESGPDDPAYLIYTSGSTGVPKGVAVTRGNLRFSTLARLAWYPWKPERFLLVPSFAFDSSVAGIYWTLAAGGALILPNAEEANSPRALAGLIVTRKADSLLCVPSLYAEILKELRGRSHALQRVIVAGEQCPWSLVEAHHKALSGVSLYNEYGPTESTVWATAAELGAAEDGRRPVPIGRPVPGVRTYVVDQRGRLQAVGVPGEIWIGGGGVAAGYHQREEETRRVFVPDPFAVEPGGRVYRTGDRGRWREDRVLEFLGRQDEQFKIHGYRIEPGEIEETLRRLPGVRDAAVAVTRAQSGREEEDPGVEELCLRLERLEETQRQALLEQAEGPPPHAEERTPEQAAREVRRPRFRLTLRSRPGEFVRTPRALQRDWLLEQALAEFADDLDHLDALARTLAPGQESALRDENWDIAQAALPAQKIMEDWQVPLMQAMAAHVTEGHGDVLEIGFGRGVSAEFIQQAGVRSHTVVEPNHHSVEHYFRPWRQRHPEKDIQLLQGRWQEVEDRLGSYDGIFFHAFPLNEKEFIDYILRSVTFAEHAFPAMAAHLREGGVFTYLTTEIDSLSRRHQRALFRHFRSLTLSVQPVSVPVDTQDAWWAPSMVVIKAVK